jgi:hypothetical protein
MPIVTLLVLGTSQGLTLPSNSGSLIVKIETGRLMGDNASCKQEYFVMNNNSRFDVKAKTSSDSLQHFKRENLLESNILH